MAWRGISSRRARLVVASFLMLFVELTVIRWAGASVVYLNAFTNLLLLASFLGIGLAFLRAPSSPSLVPYAPLALAAFAVLVVLFSVEASGPATSRQLQGAFGWPALPAWLHLPLLFCAATGVLMTITDEVARTFARFAPLDAYRLDVLGSLAGIVAFALVSFAGLGPIVWTLVAAGTFVALLHGRLHVIPIAGLAVVVALAVLQAAVERDIWSPYNRITVETREDRTAITANGFPHQAIAPVETLRATEPFYLVPYERAASLQRVLVIGAGAGNDVAAALAARARHVDAVEIDGELVELGRELHPNDPYADPRVDLHVDDGRAFLERTHGAFDLVVFALPQSVVTVGGQASVRLESFLLTREAFASARRHLAPDGALVVIDGRRRLVYEGLVATIADVFGRRPCLELIPAARGKRAVLTIGNRPGAVACPRAPAIRRDASALPTDDRPFPYLRGRAIPSVYVGSMAAVLLTAAMAIRAVAGPLRTFRRFLDLFFMGAGFLLLETSNIVRFALLFGTTWFVNALVFFGILATVLAAVEFAARFRPNRRLLFVALGVAIGVAWLIPPDVLLDLPVIPRFVAAVAVTFVPVFLGNVVFAERFATTRDSTLAFGWNLLGAMMGGVLEYASLTVGYRSILLVVAALYAVAFMTAPAHDNAE